MNRFLPGVLLGALLGVALGFVAFSGGETEDAPPIHAAELENDTAEAPGSSSSPLAAVSDGVVPREVAQDQPASATLSKARVESILAKVEAPNLEEEVGALEIAGSVLDSDGNGVAGVQVRATRTDSGTPTQAPDSLDRPSSDLTLEGTVQSAAAVFARQRFGQREAISNAQGSFVIDGLVDSNYSLSAYKPGYWIQHAGGNSSVFAGAEVEFQAKRVVSAPFRILLPNGEEASEAVVICEGLVRGNHVPRIGPFAWTPGAPTVKLPEGKLKLTAVGEVFGRLDNGYNADAALKSETREVEIPASGLTEPLVFELEGQLGVRGRVTAVSAAGVSSTVVYFSRLAESGEVDPAMLKTAKQRESVALGGEFSFLNVVPGRYGVGLSRSWNGRIETHRVIEIESSIVQCDLELPALELSEFLQVEVFGPNGDSLSGATFIFMRELSNGTNSTGIRSNRTEGGRYFLEVPDEYRESYYASEVSIAKYTLTVDHADYGPKVVLLKQGQKEVQAVLVEPAGLEATVLGYETSDIFGRASLEIVKLNDEGKQLNLYHHWSRAELGEDGVKDFGNLGPGRYRLTLSVTPKGEHRRTRKTIATIELELGTGTNRVPIPIPDLYSLSVDVAGAAGASLSLTSREEAGQARVGFSAWESCDEQGRGEFTDLLPGEYELIARAGAKNKRIAVSIPTASVQLDPANW